MAQRIMRPQTLPNTLKSTILPIPIAAARPVAISQFQTRHSSHSPLGTPPAAPRKKVTISTLQALYNRDEPITMMTAHDFPSAHVADHAGMDMILVGDSLAIVALGMEDTSEVMLEEMILHCRSVARATKAAFTVGSPSTLDSIEILMSFHRLVTFLWAHTKFLLSKLSNPQYGS